MKCTSADARQLQNSSVVINAAKLKDYLKIYQNARYFGFDDVTTAVTGLRELFASTQAITYGQVYAVIQSEIKQLDDDAVSSVVKTMINAIVSDFKALASAKTVRRDDVIPPNSTTPSASSSHTVRRTNRVDQYLTKRELGLGLGISGEGVDAAVVASMITNIIFREGSANNTMFKLQELYKVIPAGGILTLKQFNDAIRNTMCYPDDKPKVEALKDLIKQHRTVALEGMAPVKDHR